MRKAQRLMRSTIGQNLHTRPARSVALGIALAAVVLDYLIVIARLDSQVRCVLAMLAFGTIVYVTDGELSSIGLRIRPKQGWRQWFRWTFRITWMLGACLAVGFGIWHLSGHHIPLQTTRPEWFWPVFLHMCFVAPLLEETLYRLVACVPLVPVIGCWPTILVNGVLFGALHVVYGSPSPENLVGGFFLAWVYLKSETILLPVLLHAGGNLLVLGAQIAGWYAVNGGG